MWSELLKLKNVSKGFKKIILKAKKNNRKTPCKVHCDKGLESRNKHFRIVLKQYNIKMYHTENEEKSSNIERFNRTLNQKMKIKFEDRNNFNWIDILKHLIHEYNYKDVHRTIKRNRVK